MTGTVEVAGVPGVPLPADHPRRWRRYAALGDSLSEGLGDPLPGGRTRGWATVLADRLRAREPGLEFTNLAVRGYLAHHVLERQVAAALRFEPDLVSVFIGGNDVLMRRVFRPERFAAELDDLVSPFVERGATVVLSTLPDLTACSPVPPPFRWRLQERLREANAVIEVAAARHGTVLLDAWSDPRTRRHGMWSIDRIHPSADGHRLIAAGVVELLGLPVEPADREPVRDSLAGFVGRTVGEVSWLALHGLPRRGRRR